MGAAGLPSDYLIGLVRHAAVMTVVNDSGVSNDCHKRHCVSEPCARTGCEMTGSPGCEKQTGGHVSAV